MIRSSDHLLSQLYLQRRKNASFLLLFLFLIHKNTILFLKCQYICTVHEMFSVRISIVHRQTSKRSNPINESNFALKSKTSINFNVIQNKYE